MGVKQLYLFPKEYIKPLVPGEPSFYTPARAQPRQSSPSRTQRAKRSPPGSRWSAPARPGQPLPGQVTARAHVTRPECGRWKAEVERS